jgi:hypothetical protein
MIIHKNKSEIRISKFETILNDLNLNERNKAFFIKKLWQSQFPTEGGEWKNMGIGFRIAEVHLAQMHLVESGDISSFPEVLTRG